MKTKFYNYKIWTALMLFIIMQIGNSKLSAQISAYSFSNSLSTYIPITGGTVLSVTTSDDDNNYAPSPIGFSFLYGSTPYTQIGVSANGYVRLGNSTATYYGDVLSNQLQTLSPFNEDLQGKGMTSSEVRLQTLGVAPNRVCVIQWRDWGRYQNTTYTLDTLNFQVRLYEDSNRLEFVYGRCALGSTGAGPLSVGVGINGSVLTDFNLRTGSSFITNSAGTLNTQLINSSVTAYPDLGRTYRFTRPLMVYDSTITNQITAAVMAGKTNQAILNIQVYMRGLDFPLTVSSFTFNTNGTSNTSDILNSKVYYTGTNPAFNTASQFGTAVLSPNGTFIINGTTQLVNGINNFWLTYDISNSALTNNVLDAECTSITIDNTPQIPLVTAPIGGRTIRSAMNGTYTVGQFGQFPTITQAVNELNALGATGNVTFELINQVYSSSTGEVFPIIITAYDGMSAQRSLTIKPLSNLSPIITGSSSNSIFIIDGAKYVTIDGRWSYVDLNKNITIENTNTSITATVVQYINDAIGSTLRNTVIRGANANTNQTVQPVLGSVYIGRTTQAIPYGNDSISIKFNTFARSNSLPYSFGIVSDGQSNIIQNNHNTLDSNWFYGFGYNAIFVTANNTGNGGNWNIRGNSFYDTSAATTTLNSLVCINFVPGTYSNNNIISGNFIGGRGPMAAGTDRWTLTSAIGFTGIYANGGTTTGITLENNIIRNLRFENTTTSTMYGFWLINPGVMKIGTAGNGNIIGSATDTNNIWLNNNGVFYGIYSTTTNDISVEDNLVSNINSTNTGTSAAVRAIYIQSGSSNTTRIVNNTIRAMHTRSTNTGSTTACAWNGIMLASSSPNQFILNNTIGGSNQEDSCSIYFAGGSRMIGILTSNGSNNIVGNSIKGLYSLSNVANTANTTANIIGISTSSGTNGQAIRNNTIDVLVLRTPSIGHNIQGIVSSSGAALIDNNTISNFYATSTSTTTSTGASINGISCSASQFQTITNNTIYNFDNTLNAASQINGIVLSSGSGHTVSGNTIRNLRTMGTSASGSIVGINILSSGMNQNVIANTIHSLVSYNTALTPFIAGIIFNGSSTILGNNSNVSRNIIHSFNLAVAATASTITGIQAAAGNATYANNMIRLGRDTAGLVLSRSGTFRGIHQNISGVVVNRFYHNSIYLESAPNSFANATAAFEVAGNITAPGFTDIKNNIIVNNTINAGATANHYVLRFVGTSMANITSNFNIYGLIPSANSFVSSISTANYATMPAWQTISLMDGSSGLGTAPFLDATGDYTAVNLRVTTSNNIEGTGDSTIAAIVTDDVDGNLRSSLTGTDIGAHAGNFTYSADIIAPSIVYNSLVNTAATTNRVITANIFDAGAVPLSGTSKPRIFFKKMAAGTWQSAAGVLASGNRFNGNWQFTIDNSLMSGVTLNDSVYYFVIAQDSMAGNTISNKMFATASNVNTISAYPTAPLSYKITAAFPSTVLVGTGQTYTSLTGTGGLFEAINGGVLSGNVEALITSNITTETGTTQLNQWNEEGVGGYQLTIRPQGSTQMIVSTTGANASGFIRLNNVKRFKMLGYSPTGTPNDTNLVIRATSTTTPALGFLYAGGNDTFINVIFESGISTTTSGVVFVSATPLPTIATDGLNNTLFRLCHFRQNTATPATLPANGFYATGTVPRFNNNITLENNSFYNYSGSGINVSSTGNGNNWNISGNSFYLNAIAAATTAHIAINFLPGATSDNNIINGNWIGGTSRFVGGNAYTSNSTFIGIQASSGLSSRTTINNNVLANFTTSATGTTYTGISATGTSANYTINGNRIGHPSSLVLSINSAGNGRFIGINSTATGNVTVANDTIINISNTNTSTSAGITGINVGSGSANVTLIDNNRVIGLRLACTNTGATTAAAIQGITLTSSSLNQTISNNELRTFVNSNNSVAYQMLGIMNTGGITKINNNGIYGISSRTTSTSTAGTSTPIVGIMNYSGSAGFQVTDNNVIDSVYYTAVTPTIVQMAGIMHTSSSAVITSNIIRNFNSQSISTSTSSSSAIVGIMVTNSGVNNTISQNKVSVLQLWSSTASSIIGVFVSNSTSITGNNSFISRNLIHSFSSSSIGTAIPVFTGIYNNVGYATYSNNMIRLGLDAVGVLFADPRLIRGIYQFNTTQNKYYHNSVLISGAPTSGSAATYAFEISGQILTNQFVDIRNNIFVNTTSTGGTGTGFNYGIKILDSLRIRSDYNLFYVNGTNGVVGRTSVDYPTLAGSQISWKGTTGLDAASGYGDPNFTSAAYGIADNAILSVQTSNPIERSGDPTLTLVTEDYFGTQRGVNSPSDIGAHSSNFNNLPDVFPPVIAFIPLGASGTLSGTRPLNNVSITDNVGIPLVGSNVPRVYYSKDGIGWFSSAAISISGNSTNATANFNIDYTPMMPLTTNDTIRYYVIAQDLAGNLISNSLFAEASSVNSVVAHPLKPYTFTFYPVIPANTILSVGTGQTYTSLSNAGGLFEYINSRSLGGNVFAEITSDLLNETGAVLLTQFAEDGIGAGTYNLTIRPSNSTSTPRLIEGIAATGMIVMNGTNRLKITGVRANGVSTERLLRFRNYSTAGPTIILGNGAAANRIHNCIIEGSTTSAVSGVIYLTVTTGTQGVNRDTISGCVITNNTGVALPNGIPTFPIYSDGLANVLNSRNVFMNNEISNFMGSGIVIANYNGDNNVVTNNSFFNNLPITINGATQFAGVNMYATLGQSSGNIITGNFMGGSAPLCAGAPWIGNNLTTTFIGFRVDVGAGSTTLIQNNTVQNINFPNPGANTFYGIYSVNGNVDISNNLVGHPTLANSIVWANAATHIGIYYNGTNNAVINNNIVAGLTMGTLGMTGNLYAIYPIGGTVTSINNNTIGSLTTPNSVVMNSTGNLYAIYPSLPVNLTSSYTVNNNTIANVSAPGNQSTINVKGLYFGNSAPPIVRNNVIRDITTNNTNITSSFSNALIGIHNALGASTVGIFENNTIYNLKALNNTAVNTNVTGISITNGQNSIVNANRIYALTNASTSTNTNPTPSVTGINICNGPSTNVFLTNNQITLGDGQNTNTQFTGVWCQFSSTSFTLNAINNSILITGVAGSGANQNSYAFMRGINTGTEQLTYLNLRNNIFANNRTGGAGKHYATSNQTTTPTNTYWNGQSSQFNLLVSANANTIGEWGLSNLNFNDWILNSNSDAFSYAATAGTGVGQINLNNLFTNPVVGNLGINSANSAAWYVYGKAMAGIQANNLSTDYSGLSRSTLQGIANTIGAVQLSTPPSAMPVAAIASSAPSANTTSTYTFAGRNVASINWGTSVPSTAILYDYTGVNPSNSPTGNNFNRYTRVDLTGGTPPYNYGAVLNFDAANMGFINNSNNIRISNANSATTPIWTTQTTSVVNNVTSTVSVSGLSATATAIMLTGTENTAPPVLLSTNPTARQVSGTVSIYGKLFTGATNLLFNGTLQPTFNLVNDTLITTTVPVGANTGPISLTNPFGTSVSTFNFTVIQAPSILSFNPSIGTRGSLVNISGSGFSTATQVQFNSVTAAFVVDNNNSITATVPATATTGTISVTNPAGTATSSASYTVILAPTVVSFNPTSGPIGTNVAITGNNFQAISDVKFNGVSASFVVNSATSINATVPVGATTGTISVINGSGTGVSGASYTVTTPPIITNFTPSAGGPGATVTISGTNFTGATQVQFNGVNATGFTVVNSSTITATVPTLATTGPISVTTPSGTDLSGSNFTVYPNLVVSTTQAVSGGPYNKVTITSTGNATLATGIIAFDSIIVQSGGILDFGGNGISGNGSFNANAGSTLLISSPFGLGATGNILGHLQTSGTRNYSTAANYNYNGMAAQLTGDGLPVTVNNLNVFNNAGLTLSSSLTVSGTLTLGNGNLTLNGSNLTSSGAITGASAFGYIVTGNLVSSTGTLRRTVTNNATNVLFPIGNATYTPAQIQLTNASTTDVFSVRVFSGVLSAGTSGTAFTNNAVGKTWMINENVSGGSNATVTLTWDGASELPSFIRTNCAVAFYNGTNWMTSSYAAATGSDPYTRTRANITTFTGPFSVGDNTGTLPVKLVTFKGVKSGDDAKLNWQTASEHNNSHFEVERSFDGVDFVYIGSLDGKGFSNKLINYNFVDEAVFNASVRTVYYKLKQVDFDGNSEYFGPVVINNDENVDLISNVSIYPNPFTNEINVDFVVSEKGAVDVTITDMQGRQLISQKINSGKGFNNINLQLPGELKDGFYFLNVTTNGRTIKQKLVKSGN